VNQVSSKIAWGSVELSHLAQKSRLKLTDRLFVLIALAAILTWMFPHITVAQTVQETPLVFDVNSFPKLPEGPYPETGRDYLGEALAAAEIKARDPRVELLEQYLISKRSPLAPHAEMLLTYYHYRLILGISFAESNFCKQNIRPHNCWGIGGGRPEVYTDYNHALDRANGLIQRYHDLGMTTPKLMRNSWVGWQNDSWIVAVNMVTTDLEKLGL
jgi:hypothetical protein